MCIRDRHVTVPIKDLFGSVFFISVGMMVDPTIIAQYWVPILILSAVVIVGMIVFGTFLANANFKNMFVKKEIYFVSFLRLIFIPLCMMGLFRLCGVTGDLLAAMTISSSAPTATNTAMYASKYDNDTALGSEIAAQSSVLSIITMPVIVALAYVM